jgi:hypothetical protein
LLHILRIPFVCTSSSSSVAYDSQVCSFHGVGEFLHIPFTGLELFD